MNACYTSLIMTVSIARDDGLLKRVRGTPLPAWAYLFGRIVAHYARRHIARGDYRRVRGGLLRRRRARKDPSRLRVTIVVGAAAFSALGLALASLTPNAEAAPAVANATILPILFISDVFIRLDDPPQWLATLGDIFPVKHLSEASQAAFSPFETGAGFEWLDLAIVAVWGVVGALIAVRFFSWYPRE